MPTLQTADRVFLTLESHVPQHVAALGTFVKPDGVPSDFTQRLADRLREITAYAAPFNFRLARPSLKAVAPSYAVLADDDIDINYHVRVQALPQPGTERQLGELVSWLHSLPMDMTRPLWEFHLIDGLQDDRFGLYFKVHHALMDGVGGAQRLQRMLTTDPVDLAQRPLWSVVAPKGQSAPRATRRSGIAEAARTIQGLSRIVVRNAKDGRRSDQPDLALPSHAPRTILNERIGPHRRAATQSYELERLRAVAKAGGVTLNDVFLAMTGGALRCYLAELDALPADSLLAGTPVNVRVAGDDSTNAFSFTVMKLATDIADPVERIQAISRSSTLAKERLSGLSKPVAINSAALFMLPFLVGNMVGLAGRRRSPMNIYLSNVPGPVEQQYWAGARLEAMCPFGIPMHGAGLFIASLTVSGRFCVGIVGDSDTVPHVQRIAVSMGEALDELEQALGLR
jgi:diacylglycerol O-acyltransferase / wax synthase